MSKHDSRAVSRILHTLSGAAVHFTYDDSTRQLIFHGVGVDPLPVVISARYARSVTQTSPHAVRKSGKRVYFHGAQQQCQGQGHSSERCCLFTSNDGLVNVHVTYNKLNPLDESRKYSVCGSELDFTISLAQTASPNASSADLAPLRLSELWFEYGALMNHLGGKGGRDHWRMFQQGFQSWNGAESYSPERDLPNYSILSRLGLAVHFLDTDSPLWRQRRGVTSSNVLMLHPHEKQKTGSKKEVRSLLIGCTTTNVATADFLATSKKRRADITAVLDYDGIPITEEGIPGENMVIVYGTSPQSAIDWYASMCIPKIESLAPFSELMKYERAPIGWSSWYQFLERVTEKDMHGVLEVISQNQRLNRVIQYVQLDDGYQSAIGDWCTTNSKFPSGLKDLCDRIKAKGYVPGIWLAPFVAGQYSKAFTEHPEWFLRDLRNPKKFVLGVYNPAWGVACCDHSTYSLDLTHPGALDFLERTFAQLVEYGFRLFKIDFLLAGIRRGLRYDSTISRTQAYKMGIQRIRKAIGPQSFLLGCGAPVAPSVATVKFDIGGVERESAVFDAMRVSSDTSSSWKMSTIARLVASDVDPPGVRRALHGNTGRWFMHGRHWAYNDPDVLVLRKNNSNLSLNEVIFQTTVIGMTGGLLVLSDDIRTLERSRLEIGLRVMPPTTLRGWAMHFLEEFEPSVFVCTSTDWFNAQVGDVGHYRGQGAVVSVLNWSDRKVAKHNLTTVWRNVLEKYNVWRDVTPCPEDRVKFDESLSLEHDLDQDTHCVCFFDFWTRRVQGIAVVNKKGATVKMLNVLGRSDRLRYKYGERKPSGGGLFGCSGTLPEASDSQIHLSPRSLMCLQVTRFCYQHPTIVGSTMHMTSLADGLISWSREGSQLNVKGKFSLACRTGKIHVVFPSSIQASSARVHDLVHCSAKIERQPEGDGAKRERETKSRGIIPVDLADGDVLPDHINQMCIKVGLEKDVYDREESWGFSLSFGSTS